MAKQIPYDQLSVNDLTVNHEDDPYSSFPLLVFKKIGVFPRSFFINTTNHARGTQGTGSEKGEALYCTMEDGWDRTSWPIPYVNIDGAFQIFDRRHTFRTAEKLNVSQLPGAEYVRADLPEWEWLSDRAVLEIAAIRGNVFSPVPADAKDHHFVHAAVNVFKLQGIKDPNNDTVHSILKLMGIERRYTSLSTVKGIITKIRNELADVNSVVGKVSHCTNDDDIRVFLKSTIDNPCPITFYDNIETDTTIYLLKQMDKGFNDRYATDILRKMCEAEEKGKKLIVLLYSKHENSKKILEDRNSFKEQLLYNWNLFRNAGCKDFKKILNDAAFAHLGNRDITTFDAELYIKDQIDGETEPYLLDLGA